MADIETLEFFVPSNRKNKNGSKRGMDGMNEIVKESRACAAYANVRKAENEQWVAGFARAAMREAGWETKDRLHTVVLTFVEPNMKRDDDNIFAGAKYVLDALCKPVVGESRTVHRNGCGAIPDDDPRHVALVCKRGAEDRNNPGIKVKIYREAD